MSMQRGVNTGADTLLVNKECPFHNPHATSLLQRPLTIKPNILHGSNDDDSKPYHNTVV